MNALPPPASLHAARAGGVALALSLLLVLPAVAGESVVVEFGSPMRLRANASDPGMGLAWVAAEFDGASWLAGQYGTGYETSPPGASALIQTPVPPGVYSVYTRASFQVADVAAVNRVTLGIDYDDGYVAWLNGVEIARSASMPAGDPTWSTNSGPHESSNGASPDYDPIVDVTTAALPALQAGNNVLAVGVWNSGAPTSSDLVLVPRLALGDAVVRGPYLQSGTPTSVIVRWRTAIPADGVVRYGTTPGALDLMATDASSGTEHTVLVQGLTPATTYYYSVGTSAGPLAGGDEGHAFATPPPTGESPPMRVWALGDSGTADAAARSVRDAYEAYTADRPTDLWLMLGDNAYNSGTDLEYQQAVFETYPETLRTSVLWPTYGNHDAVSADSATQTGPYYDIFDLPRQGEAGGVASGTEAYYSFDVANVHFVCLDSSETNRSAGSPMLVWLAADLAAPAGDWIIAFWHHPPYSKGSHDSDTEIELIEMRQNVLPILEALGVDLVLAGHSHGYERSYLIDGHYGASSTLTEAMKLDAGDGRIEGDGAYAKPSAGHPAHKGAVHVVAGNAGVVRSGSYDHPAMYLSVSELGSLVVDVVGRQLDLIMLTPTGAIRDHFTMVKGPGAPPAADFAAAPLLGAAPLDVAFTDLSSGGATVWRWDFENDGVFDDSSRHPIGHYTTPGVYTVRLRVMSGFGADEEIKPGYVCVLSAGGQGDVDADGVPDGADVCPCAADPAQDDLDGDGLGDACDPDDDGDGLADDQDCAPRNADVTGIPGDVGPTVTMGPTIEAISWGPVAQAAFYNVYRGALSVGASFEYNHECFDAASADTSSQDAGVPPVGGLYFYYASAENECGEGGLGSSADGTPRPNSRPCP